MQEKENKNPAQAEFRSKRVHFSITPSTYKNLLELADKKESSLNGLVNQVLERYIKRELKKERELEA
jgi:predicted HicB family RNase H-like nuclease